MLEFLRKTKDGIAPTLDEVESLIEQVDKLKGNLLDLKIAIANGSPKAQKQIPNLLVAIQGNLERDLKLLETVQRKVKISPKKGNIVFDSGDISIISLFTYQVLDELDSFFLEMAELKAEKLNMPEIIRKINRNFIVKESLIDYLINGLKINEYNNAKTISEFKNKIKIIVKNILDSILSEMITDSYILGIEKAISSNKQSYFCLSEESFRKIDSENDCPYDKSYNSFKIQLEKIIEPKFDR